MAYNLLKALVKKGTQSAAELTKKANVYFAAGQLTAEEYTEVMALIAEM